LETTVTSVTNVSQSLREDVQLLPFYYLEADYTKIPSTSRNQLQAYLTDIMFPLALVQDWALQFTDKMAVTRYRFIIATDAISYYPESFQIDELTYEEWLAVLKENATGFLPLHHIHSIHGNYDALIYAVPWVKDSYLYVCLDINRIRQSMIDQSNLETYRMTIKRGDGSLLYTDLSDPLSEYHSITKKTANGNLIITVHIPHTALTEQMGPLYSFLGLYLTLCIIGLVVIIILGTHFSSRPLIKIINTLEDNNYGHKQRMTMPYGFQYIQNKIQDYENDLHQYRETLDTQTKVLQARFMEKAINGSLTTDTDYESFLSYFPDFPRRFCLILIELTEQPIENGVIYTNALSLIQYYLSQNIPLAYQQQLTTQTLLLVVSESDYDSASDTINHLIANVNDEEPCYHAWGISSKFCDHPRNIPSAYLQVQDLRSRIATQSLNQLCTVSDVKVSRKTGFQIADTLTIYSSIVNGNKELALIRLESYSEHLEAHNRSVFEMFRAILLCIKQEYADLLLDTELPFYQPQADLYALLEEAIITFCDYFRSQKEQVESDSFAQQIKAYLDLHFTDDSLCSTTLEEQFRCSFGKIRKAFSKDIGTPISTYIEMKRMTLANELLFRGEYSVSEVARKCGFINDNTFYKAYRRTFGHAPTSAKPDRQ